MRFYENLLGFLSFNIKGEKTMTWTILVLVLGIALYLFGGKMLKQSGGKSQDSRMDLVKNSVKVLAIVLIAGSTCRLWTPYYLTSVNPMILQEMVQGMQTQKSAEGNREVRGYLHKNADKMMADAPILGNVNAKKTIFLFTDYSCPYCRRVHGELKRVMKDDSNVRVVVKNFVVHGPLSDAPARAVIAAKLQGDDKAAALDAALMDAEYYTQSDLKDQSKIDEKITKNVMKLAKKVGLDVDQLQKDMNGPVVARELGQVRDLAQRFQIGGTPFLIVNDNVFPGAVPYDQIMNALNK